MLKKIKMYLAIRSTLFSIIKGSILSPALFAVYVDDLLQELRALGVGCHIAEIFYSAPYFCDDILLLAPAS